jgi:hypothetical protein
VRRLLRLPLSLHDVGRLLAAEKSHGVVGQHERPAANAVNAQFSVANFVVQVPQGQV